MSHQWVKVSGSSQKMPTLSLFAGNDKNGDGIYVGKTTSADGPVPAKLVHNSSKLQLACLFPYGGKEHFGSNAEVLTGRNFDWVRASNGDVPANAVPVGQFFIGRAFVEGNVCVVGKIQKSHKCMYAPYGGKEHNFTNYDVLVQC